MDHLSLPIDPISHELLADDGLRLGLVDTRDPEAYASWFRVESRGFHGSPMADDAVEQRRGFAKDTRITGVWDDAAALPAEPVATSQAWPTEITVPGGRSVPSWAISGVTVAPTHRRRGIARALLEGELRAARDLGLPVAALTVSESTIYGRFGFGPAALGRELRIDTRRAVWTGPEPAGRVHFVTAENLVEDGLALVERVRLGTPGEMTYGGVLWHRQLGLLIGEEDGKKRRFVRYDDEHGQPQGFASFSVTGDRDDFTHHRLDLLQLVTATPDAHAALWRFVLEMDLVSEVVAHLRPVDDPVRWMVSDFRGVRVTESDHLWLRVLDVPAALEARTYTGAGQIVLGVSDPDGFADGTWLLDVDTSGSAGVSTTDRPADVRLTAADLGSVYLGGVSPLVLAAAGRLTGDAARLEALSRSPVAPWLSIWF